MKREEKNRQMRRKIMDRALLEFSSRGYEAGSVNNICAEDGISKGIIYHYFKTKDDLYLACVEECFHLLTDHLKTHALCRSAVIEEQLREYFLSRGDFFREHPVYRRIFCDAIMSPPPHIKDEVATRTHDFDEINRLILEKMLEPTALREDITKEEVIDIFRLFQDFINAKYPSGDASAQEFEMRDEICYKAMDILLYGVLKRKEDDA